MRIGLSLGLTQPLGKGTPAGPPAKTEADFNAHIATLAVNGAAAWANSATEGRWVTTVGTTSGHMYGSSWSDLYYVASTNCRAIQHAMPSLAVFNALAVGQQVYFRTVASSHVLIWTGKDRNGYASMSEDDGIADSSLLMNQYIRWDRALGKAFTGNPSVGSAETEYVIP